MFGCAVVCVGLAAGGTRGLRGETRRALLIGIDHYAPPQGAALPVAPGGHPADSRFSANASWMNLQGPSTDVAGMSVLLKDKYGFGDIRVLPEEQATRQGILDAIAELVARTGPGDLVVFYYAGHGSQRLDTRSSKNHLDETIVPNDAWKGVADIRDKELALLFNRIVNERGARLTAIFDSCHSGTMARGATHSVQRTLPYDDRDVAREPGAVTEGDLKQVPQKGNAIIVAAAAATEAAVEAQYPEDGEVHGAFTRALVRVLRANTQAMSAEETIAQVSAVLHADPVPFQQPSVEGRVKESLFGEPVPPHGLRVRVAKVEGAKVTLDMGSAAGFDVGTQFLAIDGAAGGPRTLIEVIKINGPTAATAVVKAGAAKVGVGDTFEMSKMMYPQAARLAIYLPRETPPATEVVDASAIEKVRGMFPGLTWVSDPTATQINYFVAPGTAGWVAIDQNGKSVAPGRKVQGAAYLLLAPPRDLVSRIQQSEPFQRSAFAFTANLSEANYILTMRLRGDGRPEYALLSPEVLANHAAAAYVRSEESDSLEAGLNDGVAPEVVCRNDVSLPVRTAWLRRPTGEADEARLATALDRRILLLGRLRMWQQAPALAPGSSGWPYRLAITKHDSLAPVPAGPLRPKAEYDVQLIETPAATARAVIPKYLYLFGFDCAANPVLLYPTDDLAGDAESPQRNPRGEYPASLKIGSEQVVWTPFGADTLFLIASKERIADPHVLTDDGTIERMRSLARGSEDPLTELVTSMGDATVRGPATVPKDWLVQLLVIPSRP
jgi:hypothetical protein